MSHTVQAPVPPTPQQVPPALWQHVSSARWFAAKGRDARPGRLVPLDWFVQTDQVAVRAVVVEAVLPDGVSEFYQVLVSHRDEPANGLLWSQEEGELPHVHDALQDADALRLLVDALGMASESPTWTCHVVRPVDLHGELTVFGGEQSNTSILVGDEAMVKFFRRLEPGANLDIAVHDALARAGVDSVATLHGWVSASVPEWGESTDLAMVVEKLPRARDGWEVATEAARAAHEFSDDAAALGEALATIHLALADTFPVVTLEGAHISEGMRRRAEAAAAEAPALAELLPRLVPLFDGLAASGVPGQRVHGDFHLGQTLSTADGWRIIDFEGEPIKTLAERSEPDCPWRDVAGMLRSFAYATSSCDDPRSPEALAWQEATQQAFLDAYVRASSTSLGEAEQQLLDAYVADKAIYEVVYETRNRPDWVHIPMRALEQLAQERN